MEMNAVRNNVYTNEISAVGLGNVQGIAKISCISDGKCDTFLDSSLKYRYLLGHFQNNDDKNSVVDEKFKGEKLCLKTRDIIRDMTNQIEDISTRPSCYIFGKDLPVFTKVTDFQKQMGHKTQKSSETPNNATIVVESVLDDVLENMMTQCLDVKDGHNICCDSRIYDDKTKIAPLFNDNLEFKRKFLQNLSAKETAKFQVSTDNASGDTIHTDKGKMDLKLIQRGKKGKPTNSKSNPKFCESTEKVENTQNEKLKAYPKIDVYSKRDKFPCDITGSCFDKNGFLVIADNANLSVKSLDVTQYILLSVATLNESPWDLTYIETESQVAVTLPKTGKIQFLSISEIGFLNKEHAISVDAHCRGISYSRGCFIVSFGHSRSINGGKIQVLHTNGLLLRTFSEDASGSTLFQYPSHLAFSKDQNKLYVTDFAKRSITCLQLDGTTVDAVFKNEEVIKDPRGLTVGPDGNMFVCDFTSNCVHILTRDLTEVKVVADKTQGVITPRGIVINNKDNKMYVTMFCKQFIIVLGEE